MSSTLRFIAAASFTAVAASPAAAQEMAGGPPGACACAVPAAPVAVVAAPELPRWGIGLHAASMSLAPESDQEAQTEFGGGGFHVRYRVRPKWQLELSSAHFTERLEDGSDGDRHLSSVTLAALYHFNPYARWDWYVLAGIGGTGDASEDITDEQREASQMGHFALGAGIERRFRRFGISAELRVIGMAPPEDDEDDAPGVPTAPAMTLPAAGEEPMSGGQFSIAATYYF
jgi:hypothetical protein